MSFRVGVSLQDYMKGARYGADIYERKTDQIVGIINGFANGYFHDGQFVI